MPDPSSRPVAFVTGGSGGVGGHTCRLLASRGYRLALTYHSDEEAANRVLADLGDDSRAMRLDLTDAEAVTQAVDETAARHGRLDCLVHAAGPYVPQRYVGQFTADQFAHHVEAELMSFFHVTTAALPHLRVQGGSITAVTTFALRRFPPRDALSSIPKGGIEAMVHALAVEEGKYGIRANCVGPGALEDGMSTTSRATGDISFELIEQVVPTIPLRRLGTALEVARAVDFLASDDAAYITAQFIDVDGGFSA